MLHVIAYVNYKPGKLEELNDIYRTLVPQVLNEDGCIQYQPTIDFELGLPNQIKDERRLVVTEIWESEQAFRAHLNVPHVLEFRERIKGVVENITVQILSPLDLN